MEAVEIEVAEIEVAEIEVTRLGSWRCVCIPSGLFSSCSITQDSFYKFLEMMGFSVVWRCWDFHRDFFKIQIQYYLAGFLGFEYPYTAIIRDH